MQVTLPSTAHKSWPDYRAVWRWHFYASLFCIPFVIVLAISGSIYLFKPQIEAWNERPYDQLHVLDNSASPSQQVQAALAAVPNSTLKGYELPASKTAATRIVVRSGGEALRVYVHPQTLEVLHTFPDDQRLMRQIFRLHGELWMGDRGSMLVELAASWTIVMILTGLYLWWPRQANGLGGVAYPRLSSGSRVFWRDTHSVTGIWTSAFALLLLLSGLPWAKSWGNYFKAARRLTGTSVAQQDWTSGSESRGKQKKSVSEGHHGHGGGRGRSEPSKPLSPKDFEALDRIAATVSPLDLAPPVVIAPPDRESSHWSAKSMAANRPLRVNLIVDTSGNIVSREDFQSKHLIDKIVAVGIAAHEGQLFGWPNQLLGLITAGGLVLICASGLVLWWRRKEQGVLGAPKVTTNPRISFGLMLLVGLIGLYLPFFGTSLLVVLVLERLVLRRIPRVRDWLGLRTSGITVHPAPVGAE